MISFLSAILLSIFSLPVATASVAFCGNQDYEQGALGLAPVQTYNAAPFSPPQINYVVPPVDCPFNRDNEGYFFLTPISFTAQGEAGQATGEGVIMNPNGTLVYSAFPHSGNFTGSGDQFTFRIGLENFRGKDHLVVWMGTINNPSFGSGFNLILDETYTVVANLTVTADLNVGADLHELIITSDDTAMMTAYPAQAANLSSFGGPEKGFLLDCVVQEVDIATGKALFTWHALDQVDPSECFTEIGQAGNGTADDPWDYFHINSIQKLDDGNIVISSRHCHALYLISPSGDLIWRMGGKKSNFTFGPGANFTWQHHGRMHGGHSLSVFNNGATPLDQDFPSSQGLLLNYDENSMSVSLISARSPFNQTLTVAEGSVQILDSGDSIVGWGSAPYFSKHDRNGDMLWTAQFGLSSTSYRAFLHNWVGHPTFPPSAQLSNTSTPNDITVYTWWNGATEVRFWQLLGSKSASVPLNTTDLHPSMPAAFKLGNPVGKRWKLTYRTFEIAATVGLLVPLVAKESKTQAVVDFLQVGYSLVPSEPLTREWFAVAYEESKPPTYAIFDTFAAEEGRHIHLTGQIAQALMDNAKDLLAEDPDIGKLNVLASVVRPIAGNNAGVTKGLRVLFEAKPDKVDAVREFLKSAVPLVEAEPETAYWYAVEFPGTHKFGIVDFFPTDSGRGAHVHGKVAAALFGSAAELLTGDPDLVKLDVLAGKV
ncbi:hypothetical protein D9757_007454 [Collybiopsis confluens]|uniref:Uncharacterized protein n=1 Tax=Collybiopsis confluens TaxID=2823264 RepID=A0A8H5HJS0_9AGAR|nr:hypothetical protein D9757_007454 [Collybiopsis confluens]